LLSVEKDMFALLAVMLVTWFLLFLACAGVAGLFMAPRGTVATMAGALAVVSLVLLTLELCFGGYCWANGEGGFLAHMLGNC
jgi:hypothetical protein